MKARASGVPQRGVDVRRRVRPEHDEVPGRVKINKMDPISIAPRAFEADVVPTAAPA